MIATSVVSALLAIALPLTEASGSAGESGAATVAADQKVTLDLKDADLTKVLGNLATLIGVTPIIAPGVSGTLTVKVHASIPELLQQIERDFHLAIRVADGRMIVSKIGAPIALDVDAADRRYLADASLARRPATAPKRFDGAVEIRTSAGDARVYSLKRDGGITIPGCPPGLGIFPLDGDSVDGLPSLVLRGEGALPRVLSPSPDGNLSVDVPGCSGPLSTRLVPSSAAAVAPTSLPSFGTFLVQPRVIEVGPQEETDLSMPSIQLLGGESAGLTSKEDLPSSHGVSLFQKIETSLVVIEASENDAVVAISSSIIRDVDPGNGAAPVTIRIARARESARLTYGKTHRIVLSPTFGRGDSAVVLDLVVKRIPDR